MDNGTPPARSWARALPGTQRRRPRTQGMPALITACQAAGWRLVVFSTPIGTRFVDPAQLEQLTGEPVSI